MSEAPLLLSLFPGIGLLDRAFEEEGFCIVRGPDVLWGGDVRRFRPPAGVFAGVIGGPPCQSFVPFANLNRSMGRPERYGNLIPEYERCVREARPEWFLMENVPQAPLPEVDGYAVRELLLNTRWLGEEQDRVRRFSFGTPDGRSLTVESDALAIFEHPNKEYAVTGRGAGSWMSLDRGGVKRPPSTIARRKEALRRPFARLCELQGVEPEFLADAPFTGGGKKRVLANGVPLPMGRVIARAVKRALALTCAS